MSDPRAATLRAYLDVLEAALPEAMLLENVRGIVATRERVTHKYEALDVLRAALCRINRKHGTAYEPHALVLDAAAYGVPQRRERVFLYAARDGSGLIPPSATHAHAPGAGSGLLRFANTWDALAGFDDPEFDPSLLPRGAWADLLASIPEGSNYAHHTPRGDGEPLFGWRTKYWSFLLKLAKNRPSWTLQAQAGPATGPFHWRSRRLMVREMAALQCFPATWGIHGPATSARRQLGNAVPPPIGELLGIEIRRQLLGEKPRRREPLTPELRTDCPGPEQVLGVPAKYLHLRDDHRDHPGTGLGPGAVNRLKPELEAA